MRGDSILDILLFMLVGVALGFLSGFVPGFSSNNLSTILIAYGLISQNYHLAVTVVALEISFSFFGFLSPIIFGIGNEDTSLAIGSADLSGGNFQRGINMVVSGGLIGILVSLPVMFFAKEVYPLVYGSLKPLLGGILLLLCFYMMWIERGLLKKLFAASVFLLSGSVGLTVRGSGLIPSDYLLIPVFIGLYGFSSILSSKSEGAEIVQDIPPAEKARIASIAFVTSMFASLIQGMKRGQASALALQIGRVKREEVLFIMPMISLAFTTLSIFVLDSTGSVRGSLAFDIQEVMGDIFFSQAVLFAGVIALSACISVLILILIAKPLGRMFSRINEKYLKALGFCISALLIVNFTGAYGILIAFTTTCIGMLSSRLRVRSVHLMGVLLLPSLVTMLL